MVILLGNFLRLSLNKGKNVYRVRDELEHLQSYIQIQSIRYSGRIVYTAEVDDSLLDLYMVKLILQPIVENSILYGFEKSKAGQIHLKGMDKGDKMVFQINDDGCGIPPDAILQMKRAINLVETKKLIAAMRG